MRVSSAWQELNVGGSFNKSLQGVRLPNLKHLVFGFSFNQALEDCLGARHV